MFIKIWILFVAIMVGWASVAFGEDWTIDTQSEWTGALGRQQGIMIENGVVIPKKNTAVFSSKLRRFEVKRSASSICFAQSPVWQNWQPMENAGPSNLGDAPVLLCIAPGNYWMFGRYRASQNKTFQPEPAQLEGFDVPLLTTPEPRQFDAPGGLKPSAGGYHAWQSRDMVNWVHHGSVTEAFSIWVTSAEFANGKVYIYYDYPNDQDPHVYVDKDLTDGRPGINKGVAFKDPSDGSDCGVIRDKQGRFHLIYEDWSPINARQHSWDSPLAGHAISDNGIGNFVILDPAVDRRTNPTGEVAQYQHPHWRQHPDWQTNLATYHVHVPEQEAFGDWAAIGIGDRYYLFGDYDPVDSDSMSVGWFTSTSLESPFTWCDQIGKGHPDPDIGFAEGRFYLVTQQSTDYVSPGPWVERVEARVGVDINSDNRIDEWSDWQEVKETYRQRKGFAKQIDKTAAEICLSCLPAGQAFQFEFRLIDTTENKSMPLIDRVTLSFE